MLELPFFQELSAARRVLVAGAGGGFDVFSGLPLYFGLRDAGKEAYLANLSFSWLGSGAGRWLAPALVEVTPESEGPEGYFPEKYLYYTDTVEQVSAVIQQFRAGHSRKLKSWRDLPL